MKTEDMTDKQLIVRGICNFIIAFFFAVVAILAEGHVETWKVVVLGLASAFYYYKTMVLVGRTSNKYPE